MVEITHKNTSLRIAIAEATVKVSKEETIEAIKNNLVPKGKVFEMAKTAGLFAVKKTSDMIPDCHPLPVEFTGVSYEIDGLKIKILLEVRTIYRTGVEVEAMHGASVVALTMYDMLKPIDKGIEIHHIKLLEKKGGKSSYPTADVSHLKAGIVVCSDSISAGNGKDTSGQIIQERILNFGLAQADVQIIPDDFEKIQSTVTALVQTYNVIILTGGTGLSSRDVTPEAIIPLLDKRLIGAEETLRRYGQERMPYAMLSRSVVGTIGRCLVLALPGSSKGVAESLDAVFPALFHSFKVLDGERHL